MRFHFQWTTKVIDIDVEISQVKVILYVISYIKWPPTDTGLGDSCIFYSSFSTLRRSSKLELPVITCME